MSQPPAGQTQKPPLRGTVEKDLGDRERDQLRVTDPRSPARTRTGGQEIVGEHIKCGEKSVEVGGHETTSVVDVATATPTFGALNTTPRRPPRNSESLI